MNSSSLSQVLRILIAIVFLSVVGGGFMWVGFREITRGGMPIPGASRGATVSSGGMTRDVSRLYGPGAVITGVCVLGLLPLAWRSDQRITHGRSRKHLLICLVGASAGIVLQVVASLVWFFVRGFPNV